MTSRQNELNRLIDEYAEAEAEYLRVYEKTTHKSTSDEHTVEHSSDIRDLSKLDPAEVRREKAEKALEEFRRSGS